jgi:hypothetical protein
MRTLVGVAVILAAGLLMSAVDAAAAEPLASGMTNWSGVDLDLMKLERKGSVLTLKWRVVNGGTEAIDVGFALTGAKVTSYVIDEENGTKYYALTDKEKNVLASMHQWVDGDTYGISEEIPAGESRFYWAKFPAPPPEVTSVSVLFTGTEPLEDIPITDR